MSILGIDIGGSGIKGALVNIETGTLESERNRIPTPEHAEPGGVARVVGDLVRSFQYSGPIGAGFPAIVRHGVAYSAANIHESWIGMNVDQLLTQAAGNPVYTVNDADAAGVAEMTFGIGRDYAQSVVVMLTLGTGIGSAIFIDGRLLPNTELGHLEIGGKEAEKIASDAVRKDKELSYKKWARKRLQTVLNHIDLLFSPDVYILGGGVSKDADEFIPYLESRAKIVPAQLQNQAGIVGAALYASRQS